MKPQGLSVCLPICPLAQLIGKLESVKSLKPPNVDLDASANWSQFSWGQSANAIVSPLSKYSKSAQISLSLSQTNFSLRLPLPWFLYAVFFGKPVPVR